MTIKQYVKKFGWNMDCPVTGPYRVMSVDIGFINDEGREDETQFDIRICDVEDLNNLFNEFCRENGYPRNTVYAITIAKVGGTFDDLNKAA